MAATANGPQPKQKCLSLCEVSSYLSKFLCVEVELFTTHAPNTNKSHEIVQRITSAESYLTRFNCCFSTLAGKATGNMHFFIPSGRVMPLIYFLFCL